MPRSCAICRVTHGGFVKHPFLLDKNVASLYYCGAKTVRKCSSWIIQKTDPAYQAQAQCFLCRAVNQDYPAAKTIPLPEGVNRVLQKCFKCSEAGCLNVTCQHCVRQHSNKAMKKIVTTDPSRFRCVICCVSSSKQASLPSSSASRASSSSSASRASSSSSASRASSSSSASRASSSSSTASPAPRASLSSASLPLPSNEAPSITRSSKRPMDSDDDDEDGASPLKREKLQDDKDQEILRLRSEILRLQEKEKRLQEQVSTVEHNLQVLNKSFCSISEANKSLLEVNTRQKAELDRAARKKQEQYDQLNQALKEEKTAHALLRKQYNEGCELVASLRAQANERDTRCRLLTEEAKDLRDLLSRRVPEVRQVKEVVRMLVPATEVVAAAQQLHQDGFRASFQAPSAASSSSRYGSHSSKGVHVEELVDDN